MADDPLLNQVIRERNQAQILNRQREETIDELRVRVDQQQHAEQQRVEAQRHARRHRNAIIICYVLELVGILGWWCWPRTPTTSGMQNNTHGDSVWIHGDAVWVRERLFTNRTPSEPNVCTLKAAGALSGLANTVANLSSAEWKTYMAGVVAQFDMPESRDNATELLVQIDAHAGQMAQSTIDDVVKAWDSIGSWFAHVSEMVAMRKKKTAVVDNYQEFIEETVTNLMDNLKNDLMRHTRAMLNSIKDLIDGPFTQEARRLKRYVEALDREAQNRSWLTNPFHAFWYLNAADDAEKGKQLLARFKEAALGLRRRQHVTSDHLKFLSEYRDMLDEDLLETLRENYSTVDNDEVDLWTLASMLSDIERYMIRKDVLAKGAQLSMGHSNLEGASWVE